MGEIGIAIDKFIRFQETFSLSGKLLFSVNEPFPGNQIDIYKTCIGLELLITDLVDFFLCLCKGKET